MNARLEGQQSKAGMENRKPNKGRQQQQQHELTKME